MINNTEVKHNLHHVRVDVKLVESREPRRPRHHVITASVAQLKTLTHVAAMSRTRTNLVISLALQ